MNIKSICAPEYDISVIFKPGLERARRPINRGQSWIRPKLPSFKSSIRKMIHCESEAEATFVTFLECNLDIEDYCEQPALIEYRVGLKVFKHYPDFLIKKHGKFIFVEVKRSSADADSNVIRRTEILKHRLPKVNYAYELVVISEMDSIVISNSSFVYETARAKVKSALPPLFLDSKTKFHWTEFDSSELPHIAKFIVDGQLTIDWSIPIKADSLILKLSKEI